MAIEFDLPFAIDLPVPPGFKPRLTVSEPIDDETIAVGAARRTHVEIHLVERSQRSVQMVWLIARLHHEGHSLREIVRELEKQKIPTTGGGDKWYPTNVKRVLDGADCQKAIRELSTNRSAQTE
jgi:hypothetical protein